MFRGVKAPDKRRSEFFASDPGDYGRGIYWTSSYETAEVYGEVTNSLIILERVLLVPTDELMKLIKSYVTCNMSSDWGRERRLKGAQDMTDYFKGLGAEAVLSCGYEGGSDDYGLCIFGHGSEGHAVDK